MVGLASADTVDSEASAAVVEGSVTVAWVDPSDASDYGDLGDGADVGSGRSWVRWLGLLDGLAVDVECVEC